MIIPIRCFSCGKVVGDLWERYLKLLDDNVQDGYVYSVLYSLLSTPC